MNCYVDVIGCKREYRSVLRGKSAKSERVGYGVVYTSSLVRDQEVSEEMKMTKCLRSSRRGVALFVLLS